jgi:hypothetical protein
MSYEKQKPQTIQKALGMTRHRLEVSHNLVLCFALKF